MNLKLFRQSRMKRPRRARAGGNTPPRPNRPMFVVGFVATSFVLLLLLVGPVTRYFVPRLNPNISFVTDGERAPGIAAIRPPNTAGEAALFDGEVYRTEGRLREMSVLAIAAYSGVLDGYSHGRMPSSVEGLLAGIDRRRLSNLGLEMLPDGSGFISAHNVCHVRFRPQTLDVEIVAVPRAREDGSALLMRLPETDAYDLPPGQLRYFEALRLDGMTIPAPFATSPQIQALGWRSQLINSQMPAGSAPDKLVTWALGRARATGGAEAPTNK